MITYPSDGDTVASKFQVAVSWDAGRDPLWEQPPSPDYQWTIALTVDMSIDLDGRELTGDADAYLNHEKKIDTPSGSASFSVDLSGHPAGIAKIYATVRGPAANQTGSSLAPASFAKSLTVNVAVKPSGANSGGNPGSSPNSNSSSSSAGGITAVVLVSGGIVGGGLLLRSRVKGTKTAPKKPPLRKDGKPDTRPQDLIDADRRYAEALRSKQAFDRYSQLRKAVYSDNRLVGFVDDARTSIIGPNGLVDQTKLDKLEGTIKYWIVRDKMTQGNEYNTANAWEDTFKGWQGFSHNLPVRITLGVASGGTSEMIFMPVSSVSTMGQSIAQGNSTMKAVSAGLLQTGIELATGELIGEGIKRASPYLSSALSNLKDSYKISKLSGVNPELASEVSTLNQLANQTKGQVSRNTFMKNTEVARLGKTPAYELTSLERSALELNNNSEFRDLLSKNSNLVPNNVKDIIGTAKQKVYQQARNNSIGDTLQQMANDGHPAGQNPLFIKQTGTHAQPGNPGWNPVKSDFDHTVDFGPKYNQVYENRFNAHLESQGTSATAIDANVYGAGTSSRGAYTGSGAIKFVQNYNQVTGSDIMIRSSGDGVIMVSHETPQTSTSLLSYLKPADIPSAESNFRNFFQKDISKGGTVDNLLVSSSKLVSRMNKVNYVKNFQQTGQVSNFVQPLAAKVAQLVKEKGLSVDVAKQLVGYTGSNAQLMNDFRKIME